MQYRTFFKKYYNINFGNQYDIHHIDLNRDNNNIENLMLIPRRLHRKYHKYINMINRVDLSIIYNAKICGNNINILNYTLSILYVFADVISECNKWYDYKMYLDGKMNNIHSIKLEGENGK